MDQPAAQLEQVIRLGLFFGLFIAFAAAEYFWPREALTRARPSRWVPNLTITIGNTILLRLIFIAIGTSAVGFAALVDTWQWSLLHLLSLPSWAGLVIGFLVLDVAIWAQHVLFHRVPLFWRLHRMHHTDVNIDITTGLRFHPLEIILSMGIKFAVIAAIGVDPRAVLVFEIVLNATSMFNHANMALPIWMDRWLRMIVVTPDMHRVHHSSHAHEFNSNFGFNLPWWDRLFGTYRDQPQDGHDGMTIGLPIYRSEGWQRLPGLLKTPFVDDAVEGDAP